MEPSSASSGNRRRLFETRQDEWLVVPLYHIFGSEELSRSAPAIAELSPEPYVALNPEDASNFGKEVELFGHRLPVKIAPDLPKGIAGVRRECRRLPASICRCGAGSPDCHDQPLSHPFASSAFWWWRSRLRLG